MRVLESEAGDLGCPNTTVLPVSPDAAKGAEMVLVIGGDGTLLRAAELARPAGTPLLGVNVGHVGFLAETEPDVLSDAVDHILAGHYWVEPRMTIDVTVQQNGSVLATAWALNEATVEKAARERMLDLVTEVDGRPLSRWGCDGMVFATPTGSTAYAFSAGGPVVWPDVEALLLVPISAHALFAGPMVVSPESVLAAEVIGATGSKGGTSGAVLWCDSGARSTCHPALGSSSGEALSPCFSPGCGTMRTATSQLWAQHERTRPGHRSLLHRPAGCKVRPAGVGLARPRPGTARCTTGNRHAEAKRSRRAMLEEVRISGLGVIDEAVLELSPGFNVVTGETGAGKTMVVSGLGLLFGGRADPSRIRLEQRGRPSRRLRTDPDGEVARAGQRRGRRPDDDGATLVLVRSVSAEGRSRAFAGGRSVPPVSLLTYLSGDLVAVHGQADQRSC
jgi:NAD+ kinase